MQSLFPVTGNPADILFRIIDAEGSREYGTERVTQLQHALQCASLAEQAGAEPTLIVACLLHDIGHLIDPGANLARARGEDARHEAQAERYLKNWFGPDVIQPARLHVEAKRYLCATDISYYDSLSPASKHSLEMQGGPFDREEEREFIALPYAREAVMLRRWDDMAKLPEAITPPLEHFRRYIEAVTTVQA
ncbi:MAG: HD domain-containing protein [Alphaproteobacteria bacterium]|nr:HD domain-containing protein [Alphaproteobacteria bacterium]MBU0797939.1 HD domain-containing protein [Alphaproteobacteria bacterium]MBU0886109.1 HD domain-containing protein [Alphaproteobacteria bacterium]MBU1812749.1 HD domain-containing protein [Alphaproteobacteria bacterium]MBU2090278.1 HD domain-containing protein [Alphaproteobacteria bacterium]